MLTPAMAAAAIAVMALVTFLTRALPFLLFDRGEQPPGLILYLGRVLPPAIIAMLVVYCLRGVSFSSPGGWMPQLLAAAAVAVLHLWCRRCSKTPPHIWARLACRTHFFIFCRKKPDISPRYRNFSIMERNFFVFLFSRRICR